ncbi:hypothetical protein AGABI2DRAFT_225025 [Agaricus bisporus var. bisporus H97]|uniref:hypothetical protein n=1 Tax=Agaricus bisporus var. bisporus (strain H97 / ATCC MYA-4626 / FGSC 10389) TaxID=936046 RepID=UPI00029F7BA4|nr:hypothetical protein AGABI2DRAFT_225025 [Agaricus bisporus var. bisporus H97]EKV45180.1 hypothetical protein AGABI2DRAFT_225025 [Agaricus bisporus var. bisporus H97]
MGVQGFTPFLQKTVPHIIHKLPNRLKDLSGKKLVLDGTLITQRLHFAPSPHPYRHVLGWYNLARELNDNNIRAVCIFDGNLRAKAKALEVRKIEASRKLHVSRGTLESVRIKRLQKLKAVMANVRALDEKGKSAIAEMLSRLNASLPIEEQPPDSALVQEQPPVSSLVQEHPQDSPDVLEKSQDAFPIDEQPQDSMLVQEQQQNSLLVEEQLQDPSPVQEQPQDSRVIGFGAPELGIPANVPSAEDIKSMILSSYRDFQLTISKVASLSSSERKPKVPASGTLSLTEEMDNQEEELVLSKTQCELTLEEEKVWDELTLATSPVVESAPIPAAAEDRLHVLASRSESIADSYQRRTYVPTKTTYMESREILEAMGIPCYEIQGEHEGEGVASSLVLQGMADYVVSEDTDVLVYGAPIVRNFTSHGNPLTVIHGNDVREALDLSNDACIDFAILLGTDFSQRIRNVGPIRALKLIKEYETIENILNSQTKHQPTIPHEEYMAQVESARAIFSSPPPIPSQLRLAVMSTGTELIDQAKVAVVMERCGLGRALVADSLWDYEAALDGNYFSDNPSMIVS